MLKKRKEKSPWKVEKSKKTKVEFGKFEDSWP